jgi:hypothetical protein
MTEDNEQLFGEDDEGVFLEIEYETQEDTPRGYATNMIVQHTDHEFIISFFDLEPPLLMGSIEERREQIKKIGLLKAKCIARITVNASRMEDFIDALKTNFDKHKAKRLSEKSEE